MILQRPTPRVNRLNYWNDCYYIPKHTTHPSLPDTFLGYLPPIKYLLTLFDKKRSFVSVSKKSDYLCTDFNSALKIR